MFPAPHVASGAHWVLPGVQVPVPSPVVTQTQSGFVLLHGMNVAQVAPAHSGCGSGYCANAGVLRLDRIGADQAMVAPAPIRFRTRLRESLSLVSLSMPV